MFGGVFLLVLSKATVSSGLKFSGAKITVACVFISVLFGLAYGIQFTRRTVGFSPIITFATGGIGFCFVWRRQLTGSLVLPIIIHNVANLSVVYTLT